MTTVIFLLNSVVYNTSTWLARQTKDSEGKERGSIMSALQKVKEAVGKRLVSTVWGQWCGSLENSKVETSFQCLK